MATSIRIQQAFDTAKLEFERDLENPELFANILKTTSIDQVYDATDEIQRDQGKRLHLRALRRIEPFLERIRQYAGVIDTFAQVKSDILCLIWGPIRLLLQMSSNLSQCFSAITNALIDIGNKLPVFETFTELFNLNDRMLDVLALFYRDILDFYLVAFKFFRAKRK
jgi:hypothetical protein